MVAIIIETTLNRIKYHLCNKLTPYTLLSEFRLLFSSET